MACEKLLGKRLPVTLSKMAWGIRVSKAMANRNMQSSNKTKRMAMRWR